MTDFVQLDKYLKRISAQGAPDGSQGGLLDLLTWCGKLGLREVSEQEAQRFLELTAQDRNGWKAES